MQQSWCHLPDLKQTNSDTCVDCKCTASAHAQRWLYYGFAIRVYLRQSEEGRERNSVTQIGMPSPVGSVSSTLNAMMDCTQEGGTFIIKPLDPKQTHQVNRYDPKQNTCSFFLYLEWKLTH